MPALIDLRRRIKSVRNTQQITQAMKTVSTAKFKKAQRTVLQARPFWHTFPSLIQRAILWRENVRHPLLEKREEQKTIVVVITSDKGLCGAFNANLLAEAAEFCGEKSKTSDLRLILIGKKAVMFFKKYPFLIERTYTDNTQNLTRGDLKDLAEFLLQEFSLLRTDAVYVVYNEFRSILAPQIILYQLLPVAIQKKEEGRTETTEELPFGLIPDWEPEAKTFMEVLLPLYVKNEIAHFFSESIAAEHAARMMAMDNATNNAEDLIQDLTLELNKLRQASITKELLEIMTAVEALAEK
ncbi:MAG: ATP synthase F1 subunit gamma [Candidatus Aminicenantaceae bacterium]